MAIDVNMAYAVKMLDNRHTSISTNALDQTLSTSGHNDIHIVRHGNQFANRSSVGGFNHLYRRFRQPGLCKTPGETQSNGLIGVNGLRTTPQNRCIAGLEAETGSLNRHIRTGFVDYANNKIGRASCRERV